MRSANGGLCSCATEDSSNWSTPRILNDEEKGREYGSEQESKDEIKPLQNVEGDISNTKFKRYILDLHRHADGDGPYCDIFHSVDSIARVPNGLSN